MSTFGATHKAISLMLLILVFGIGGCDDSGPYEPTGDGLVTNILVFPSVIREGQGAVALITVTNEGQNLVVLDFHSDCWFGYMIRRGDEEPLEGLEPCVVVTGHHELTPGETLSRAFRLSPQPDWRVLPPDCDVLPPGRYTIRGGLMENQALAPWDEAILTVRQ